MHPTGLLPQRLCASPPLLLVLVRPSVSMSARAERGEKRTSPLLLQYCNQICCHQVMAESPCSLVQ